MDFLVCAAMITGDAAGRCSHKQTSLELVTATLNCGDGEKPGSGDGDLREGPRGCLNGEPPSAAVSEIQTTGVESSKMHYSDYSVGESSE